MPDNDYEYDDDEELEPQPKMATVPRSQVKKWEQAAREAEDAKARASELERELAFSKAGLDLNDRQTKALLATHDGEMSPDALRQTAIDLGFAEPPAPLVPEQEMQAHARIQNADLGGPTPPPPDLTAEINATSSPEELAALLKQRGVGDAVPSYLSS